MVQNNLNAADIEEFPREAVEDLSATELINGILLYLDDRKFPEQALYEFFSEIGSMDPEFGRRFRVTGPYRQRRSVPLRRILDFLEIGKTLEIPSPNPVDQFYRLRPVQRAAVTDDLRRREVLPSHEQNLKVLAKRFSAVIDRYIAEASPRKTS